MVKAVCLDTRIVSNYLKGKESAKKIVDEYKGNGYEIYTTTINITEFFMGAFKVGSISEERFDKLKEYFFSLHPRTITYETSILAGKLYATILKGKEIGWRDTFIASITLLNGKTIITSNPDHFKRIKEIEVIKYY